MKLVELLEGQEYTLLKGDPDIEIKRVHYDSRKVTPGSLFVCVPGFNTDGHEYADQAIEKGAIAVLVERDIVVQPGITVVKTINARRALSLLAANYYGNPSHNLKVIGVTGTNGKTTTTHLIKAILDEAGRKTAILGTLYAKIGSMEMDLGRTTPESLEIEEFMSLCLREQVEYLVMEVSSHALDLYRVEDIHFHGAVFTNLSQDHLDYHHDMNNYMRSKLKLFKITGNTGANGIVNADDTCAPYFIQEAGKNCWTFGVENDAQVTATDLSISIKGTKFVVMYPDGELHLNIQLIGVFSVYNVLAATAWALSEGIDVDTIKTALEKVAGVAGRFEQVPSKHDFTVIVDYAHTPDGLENILKTARQIVKNRLITVFGCGGDRDRTKRPLMGEIAAQYSDFCIVTSDNPRSEEPEAIIADIIPGLDKKPDSRYAIIVDRREAIRHAVYLAKPGDLVIIAGKGHETYQLVKDKVLDFDDRKIVAEFLRSRE